MVKTYKSRGVIRFSLAVNGQNKYFNFNPNPFGGSVYTTSNKAEQDALESSSHFGSDYYIESESSEVEQDKGLVKASFVTIEVNDIDEAKDYLVTNYGYASSNLRSKKAIYDAAEAQGITFEGI